MEFHSWKGLIVVLLIHHCKPQDLSTTTLLSISETNQETETSALDPELSPGEVVPEVAPPSLREVEDAVQEASELSEERGPVEVLKELLERVVEASLGETSKGRGGEEAGEAAVKEVEAEAGLEVEAAKEEAAVTGGVVVAVEAAGLGEEVKGWEVDATLADVEEGLVEKAEVTEETAQGEGALEVGEEAVVEEDGAGEGEEIIEEPAVEPEVLVEAGTILEKGEEGTEVEEETAGEMELTVEEVGQEAEGATAAVEQVDQETVAYLDPGVEEQPKGEGPAEEAEAQGGAEEGGEEVAKPPLDNYEEMETTQSVVGEPVDEEEEGGEEVEAAVGAGGGGEEGITEQGGEGEGEAVVAEEAGAGEAAVAAEGGVEDGESVGEAMELEVAAGAAGQLQTEAGEEIEVAVETPVTSDTEQPEVVPDLGEPSTEEEPEDLSVTLTSSLNREETNAVAGDDVLPGEESNHDNEIFTSKDNLNLEPVKAEPTLDNSVEEIPATPPQPEEEEKLGEPNEIVETSTNVSEGTLGLEAWKIGAISAAVFLVLETLVIIVYVLKCRNRTSSAPAPERACEEACVEPEPTTGVCEDDTILAGNGDAQQIAALDPSDLSQVVIQQQDVEEEEGEEEAAMTEGLQLDSIESVEPSQPNSEQELRTSVL